MLSREIKGTFEMFVSKLIRPKTSQVIKKLLCKFEYNLKNKYPHISILPFL